MTAPGDGKGSAGSGSRSPVTAAPPAGTGSRPGPEAGSALRTDVGPRAVRAGKRAPRITTLQLRRVDPWTTLKVALIVSIVMFFVWLIAVGLLYALFSGLDVIDRINEGWTTVTNADVTTATAEDLITAGRVFGIAAVVGAINIVTITALSTVAAFVYNAAAGMAGGVELTLGERD